MQRIIWLIAALSIFIALPARAIQVAGEITAALGEARIVASDGGQRAAAKGMALHVGDILQTGIGGHIHARMVDDALISVRPGSKIKIVSYTYQPGITEATQIRFDLLDGTARSVTGKGGEQAKDRFRMNTPVAAIGVRGTDFITQADAENTRAHVAAGAIVLAPLGAGCQANTLGVCQTASARVLTAEMRDMMLEFTRGTTEPRLVPLSDKLQITAPQAAAAGSFGKAQAQQQAHTTAEMPGHGQIDAGWQQETLEILAQAEAQPVHYQMAWGRWTWNTQADPLSVPFTEAAQGREVTVGSNEAGLFRDNGIPLLLPQNGQAEFTLRMAEVSLQQAGGATEGQVLGGVLGVNFNQKSFNTRLDIQHPALADAVALNANGVVRNNGVLQSINLASNGQVTGSLSRDGTEAGYLFNLPTAAGTLNGTTLWIR